ncbi:MAG: CotH kinase family protein [Bacteroidales bacterium]|nr:CotH kinase family protein [Bacteroidales bacterium]MDD3152194.1 CotH kinase family protein [Bacteroidales bacterium]MDD3913697.1 CotH kinase family protein [Bacteroidales bacterium]MDD4633948.1 CotH kinase family protein [Bacteroidales bacterium]
MLSIRSTLLFILLAVCININVKAQLYINEIMPCNVSSILDDTENYSGWLEVYNAGGSAVTLTGYYFTDILTNLTQYKIVADVTIAAGGYSTFWFGRNSLSSNHVDFKLKPEGGLIVLVNSSQQVVSQMLYPAQYPDISYGCTSDGGSTSNYFVSHSFGVTNNNSQTADSPCAAPSFSLEGGFYSSTVYISMSCSISGANIYYTLDGSEPTEASTAYSSPITVTSGIRTIRARTFAGGYLPSDIVTQTFFINSRQPEIHAISIVTDDDNLVNLNGDIDRPVNIELYYDGTQQLNKRLDISSETDLADNPTVKAIKLIADKKYGSNRILYEFFASKPGRRYKSLLLRNSGQDSQHSMLLDGMSQTLATALVDIDCQGYLPATVYINGNYCGMINIRERNNRYFADSNYGIDEESLYFVEIPYAGATYLEGLTGSVDEFESMYDYITGNNMSNSSNYQQACQLIDIDAFINYTVLQLFVYSLEDWPTNNYKAYKTITDGKWRWITIDLDLGFNIDNLNADAISELLNGTSWHSELVNSLLQNADFKQQFIDMFSVYLGSIFSSDNIDKVVEETAGVIRDEFDYHAQYQSFTNNFETYISNFKTFGSQRADKVYSHLQSQFSLGSPKSITITTNLEDYYNQQDELQGIRIFINGIAVPTNTFSGKYYQNSTVSLSAVAPKGYTFNNWTDVSGNIVSTNADYEFTITQDVNLTANFKSSENYSLYKLYINEVCASNSIFIDNYDGRDDWIEIYNGSNFAIDLGGMYISDDREDLTKCQIPEGYSDETTIEPYSYKIIWADSEPEQGPLHAEFNLSSTKAETVSLSMAINGSLKVIDSLTYALGANTFGRFPDGSTKLYSFYNASFGNMNISNSADEFCCTDTYFPNNNGEPYMSLSNYILDFGTDERVLGLYINNLSNSETLNWVSSGNSESYELSATSGTISPQGREYVEITIDRENFSDDLNEVVYFTGGDITLGLTIIATNEIIGIEENEIENIKIYPNPADDYFYIQIPVDENLTMQTYNLMGRLMKETKFNEGGIYREDISNLRSGIYIIKLTSTTISRSIKLIIK